MNRKQFLTAMVAALTIGLSAAWSLRAAEVGKAAPDFTLKDQTGKDVKLSELKGKIVVLEWFNVGCPVTQRHHSPASPTMKTTAARYKDKGVVWLAVCSNSDGSTAANAQAAQQLKVESLILDDSTGKVGKAYGARTTPHMFVINAQGVLAYDGGIDDNPTGGNSRPTNFVAKALDELLAGSAVSSPKTKPYGCGIKYGN